MTNETPTKICQRCSVQKSEEDFHKSYRRHDGSWTRQTICKACAKLKAQEYYQANIERLRAEGVRKQKERRDAGLDVETTRRRRLRQKYGISWEQYADLLSVQNGGCAICGSLAPGWPSIKNEFFQVDHDHSTGATRGLLCGDCNRAIGMMNDDPDRLEKAAKYLRKYSS